MVKFRVSGVAAWGCDYGRFEPGDHEVTDGDLAGLISAAAAAEKAGAGVEILDWSVSDPDLDEVVLAAVESDEVSLERQPERVAAMDDDAKAAWADWQKLEAERIAIIKEELAAAQAARTDDILEAFDAETEQLADAAGEA